MASPQVSVSSGCLWESAAQTSSGSKELGQGTCVHLQTTCVGGREGKAPGLGEAAFCPRARWSSWSLHSSPSLCFSLTPLWGTSLPPSLWLTSGLEPLTHIHLAPESQGGGCLCSLGLPLLAPPCSLFGAHFQDLCLLQEAGMDPAWNRLSRLGLPQCRRVPSVGAQASAVLSESFRCACLCLSPRVVLTTHHMSVQ